MPEEVQAPDAEMANRQVRGNRGFSSGGALVWHRKAAARRDHGPLLDRKRGFLHGRYGSVGAFVAFHRALLSVIFLMLICGNTMAQSFVTSHKNRPSGWGAQVLLQSIISVHGGFNALCNPQGCSTLFT